MLLLLVLESAQNVAAIASMEERNILPCNISIKSFLKGSQICVFKWSQVSNWLWYPNISCQYIIRSEHKLKPTSARGRDSSAVECNPNEIAMQIYFLTCHGHRFCYQQQANTLHKQLNCPRFVLMHNILPLTGWTNLDGKS